MKLKSVMMSGALVLLSFSSAMAGTSQVLSPGDTAWVIVATALVMMMTPAGLALFYGGMSRYKNLLNTFAMILATYCLVSIIWVLWGYSLAFGNSSSPLLGSMKYLFLSGINVNSLSGTIPTLLFVLFQMTFACITPALIIGSVVGRMKFSSWLVFTILWVTFVYCPVCYWVWGGGWMAKMGAIDFAGGTVVHINAGVAGLVLCLILGKRNGYGKEPMFPSSVTLTALGAGLLWFGWFGFNAGSALAANGIAASAFLTTNTAASMGAIAWMSAEWIHDKQPTVLGIASGAVAGLVGITPAAGFVTLSGALIIGLGAGIIGFFSVTVIKHKIGYDDSLDAFGVHGVCGMWGAIATGFLASPAVSQGTAGLFYGNPKQVWIQFISIVATAGFSGIGTLVVIYITKLLTNGIRVDKEFEAAGLDQSVHGERGFEID